MTIDHRPAEADRALKAKHRAMWALGDYPAVAPRHRRRPRAGPGRRPAASARASGCSTSPPGPATPASRPPAAGADGRRLRPHPRAVRRPAARPPPRPGVEIDWQQARRRGAALRRRVVRHRPVLRRRHVRPAPPGRRRRAGPGLPPGGTIGLLSWTPEGFIGQMFATMKPYAPPPPPGAQPPPLWGDEEHVRALLGDRVTEVSASRGDPRVDRVRDAGRRSATTSRRNYGPTIAVYRSIADDPEKVAALDRDLEELGRAVRPRHRRQHRAGLGVPAAHLRAQPEVRLDHVVGGGRQVARAGALGAWNRDPGSHGSPVRRRGPGLVAAPARRPGPGADLLRRPTVAPSAGRARRRSRRARRGT